MQKHLKKGAFAFLVFSPHIQQKSGIKAWKNVHFSYFLALLPLACLEK
jgi:hypothetical protein